MFQRYIGFSIPLAAAILCCLWASSARAYPLGPESPFDATTDTLPNLVEFDASENSVTYPGGHTLNSISLHGYSSEPSTTGLATPPDNGSDLPYHVTSFFDVFVDLSIDGNLYTANGVGQVSENSIDDLLPLDTVFDTEVLQLDISGGDLPAGMMLRESPSQSSTGETEIKDNGGVFHIDSFFDVFTELSLDGGETWLPSSGSVVLGSTPEPSSIVLLGMGGAVLWMAARRRRTGLA